jgi:predicted CXXCH cytochrome family protein
MGLRLMLVVSVTLPALAGESRTPHPVIEKARAGTQCIAPPATMRRDHPAMLKHQRDDTVRGGIRGAKASLKACVECHASAATASVARAETNFCVSCHSYAAVKLDCFECHTTKPGTAVARKP